MNEADLLKSELGILGEYDEFCDITLDSDGHIIELSIYDMDYQYFEYEGDLAQVLSRFAYLKKLEIEVSEYRITDIGGLAGLSNLETLMLIDCCTVDDISPLANLKNLTRLGINNAGITDIEGVRSLTGLKMLYLTGNKISNVEAISNHLELIHLNLSFNKLVDISPLRNITSLITLNVGRNQLTDISCIKQLTLLEHLDFYFNKVDDLNFLSYLPQLKTLGFSGNQVKNIDALSSLHELQRLYMIEVELENLKPLASATQLTDLSAGPIKNFDGNVVGKLTTLLNLRLENCNISDLTFLRPLINLSTLNLDNNEIVNIAPLTELKALRYINLRNNKISEPFEQLLSESLSSMDLRDNPFNAVAKQPYSAYGRFAGWYADAAYYWFERGNYDKALGYSYVDIIGKISLKIYYSKLLTTDREDDYFRLYYLMRCENIIRSIKEEEQDEEIQDIRHHLVGLIKDSKFFNRSELLVSLKENGKNVTNYNPYSEYTFYLNRGINVQPHPEMLYRLGSKTLAKRENLRELLSIYKELVTLDHPLQIAMYRVIDKILVNSFAFTPEEKESQIYYRDLLTHVKERNIPFFDTAEWFKDRYSHYLHDKPNPPKGPRLDNGTYSDTSAWTILSRLMLASAVLLVLLKACSFR